MKIPNNLGNFMIKKVFPVLVDGAELIAKKVLCSVTSTEVKKELIIKKVKAMSEDELDEVMKKNHPLGFIGVHIYDKEEKLKKIIDAVNKMDDSEVNELIMKS